MYPAGVMNIKIIDDDVWRDVLSSADVEVKTADGIPPSALKTAAQVPSCGATRCVFASTSFTLRRS